MAKDNAKLMDDFNALMGKAKPFNKDLKTKPFKMRNYFDFYNNVWTLMIPKNDTDDIEILQMSYLRYLIEISLSPQNQHIMESALVILRLALDTDDIDFAYREINGKVKYLMVVNGQIEVSEFQFEKLRKQILAQNDVEEDDDRYSSEVKKVLKEAQAFYARKNGKAADIVQQIQSYAYEMKVDLDKVFDLTIFQFKSMMGTIAHIKVADMLQYAKVAGYKEFSNPSDLPHWLSPIDDSKDDPVKLDADKVKKQMADVASM